MHSRNTLKRVLHSVIYRIMAHGTSRLYRSANPVLTFVANFPPCLQDGAIPDPTESFDTQGLHKFLPTTGTIGEMLLLLPLLGLAAVRALRAAWRPLAASSPSTMR